MRSTLIVGLATALAGLHAASSRADQTAPEMATLASQSTNLNSSLVFAKFDSSLGTLTRVDYTLSGTATGEVQFENMSTASQDVTTKLQVSLGFTVNGTALTQAVMLYDNTETVGRADGTFDFGGSAGRTYNNLSATGMKSGSTMTAAALAAFTGPGTISIPVSAIGISSATGPGRLASAFSSSASFIGTIVYEYTPGKPTGGTPEPASLALLGIGVGVVGIAARRRRRSAQV